LTYRNSLIIAVLGVPGALLGGLLVEVPKFGRKGTLAIATILTGAFLYASTTALSSEALLGWQCAFNFFSNIMYAVLYGYTPETFPTKDRGTGNALTATANRVFGIMAVGFRHHSKASADSDFSPLLPCLRISRHRHQCTLVVLFLSLLGWQLSSFHLKQGEKPACELKLQLRAARRSEEIQFRRYNH
jgi:MFS family permease